MIEKTAGTPGSVVSGSRRSYWIRLKNFSAASLPVKLTVASATFDVLQVGIFRTVGYEDTPVEYEHLASVGNDTTGVALPLNTPDSGVTLFAGSRFTAASGPANAITDYAVTNATGNNLVWGRVLGGTQFDGNLNVAAAQATANKQASAISLRPLLQ